MNQQPAAHKEFKNEKVSIQLTQEPGCLVKLVVGVAPVLLQSSYQEAMKQVRKEVSLPGFRKGKAPDAILLKHYASAIDKAWRDCLLQDAFEESIRVTLCFPVKASARNIKSAIKEVKTPSEPALLHFEYESEPHVPTVEIAELHLEQQSKPAVAQEEIDDFIHQAQLMFATWENVEGRPAEADDFVRLDIEKVHGDHTHPEFTDKRFQLIPKKMSPWLRQLVIGLSPGESAEGVSAPEETLDDQVDEDIRASFKPTPYRVTLKAIEKPILPELNDDFAKKLGGASLDDVREKVQKQLLHAAESKEQEKLASQLEEILIQKYEFDVPKSMLEREQKAIEETKVRQLQDTCELTDQELAREMPQIHRKAAEESRRRLVLFYLLREYNHKHGLTVSQEEMNQELTYLLRNVPKEHLQEIVKSIDENVYRNILTNLIISKGIGHLLTQVKINT